METVEIIFNQLSEAEIDSLVAFSQFYSKIAQTNLCEAVEIQTKFLVLKAKIKDVGIRERELSSYQKQFVDFLAEEICKNSSILKQCDKVSSPTSLLKDLGDFAINSKVNDYNIEKEKVLNVYFSYVERYANYVGRYIIENGEYQLTINTPACFKKYFSIVTEITKINDNINPHNGTEITFEVCKKFLPLLKEVQVDGLDDESFDNLFYSVFLGKYKAFLFLVEGIPVKGVSVNGLTDRDTIDTYISWAQKFGAELNLSQKQQEQIESIVNRLQRVNIAAGNDNSGCMGTVLLFLVLILSVVVVL